jgi:hypothetical protein
MSRWIFTAMTGRGERHHRGNALIRMIKKIPATTKVVIIQDPPLPTAEKVPDCLSTYLSDWRKCDYTRREGFGRQWARANRRRPRRPVPA